MSLLSIILKKIRLYDCHFGKSKMATKFRRTNVKIYFPNVFSTAFTISYYPETTNTMVVI